MSWLHILVKDRGSTFIAFQDFLGRQIVLLFFMVRRYLLKNRKCYLLL